MCTRSSSEEYPSFTFCVFFRFIPVIVYHLLLPRKPHLLLARRVGCHLVIVEDECHPVSAHKKGAIILRRCVCPFGERQVPAECGLELYQRCIGDLRQSFPDERERVVE